MISYHFSVFLWDAVAEFAKQKEKENELRAYNCILLRDRIPRLITVHWVRLDEEKNWDKINFSRVPRDSTSCFVHSSVHRLVGLSVGRSVPFLLQRRLWPFKAHHLCPNALVTSSITTSVHPHATGVAVYSALFKNHLTRVKMQQHQWTQQL